MTKSAAAVIAVLAALAAGEGARALTFNDHPPSKEIEDLRGKKGAGAYERLFRMEMRGIKWTGGKQVQLGLQCTISGGATCDPDVDFSLVRDLVGEVSPENFPAATRTPKAMMAAVDCAHLDPTVYSGCSDLSMETMENNRRWMYARLAYFNAALIGTTSELALWTKASGPNADSAKTKLARCRKAVMVSLQKELKDCRVFNTLFRPGTDALDCEAPLREDTGVHHSKCSSGATLKISAVKTRQIPGPLDLLVSPEPSESSTPTALCAAVDARTR